MKEVSLGRYAGPFNDIPFKYFIQFPIGLVLKGENGQDTRLIFHLSYPKDGDSVNSGIPEKFCKVQYLDFTEAIQLCIAAGRNCKIAKSDMSSAFRNLGISPKYWRYLVMKAVSPRDSKTYYFFDKCLPFGSSISCALFQEFSNCIAHIVRFRNRAKNLINYLDDYFFVALLEMWCNGQVEEFLLVCKMVNFPVSLEKTYFATIRLTFLGFLIDTVNQTVSILVNKVLKGKQLIMEFLNCKSGKAKVKEIQKLCGFLNFLCRCIVLGRAFTRRLYASLAANENLKAHHHMRISGEIKLDMRMWMQFLDQPTVFCRPFMDFSKTWSAKELDFMWMHLEILD